MVWPVKSAGVEGTPEILGEVDRDGLDGSMASTHSVMSNE
jgi:hypothetical protein